MNTKNKKQNKNTPVWHFPWKYREAFVICSGLLIIGFLLEIVTGSQGIQALQWPKNLYAGLIFINLITILYFYFKKTAVIHFLSHIPAAISSLILITLLVLLMGFIPQTNQPNGLIHKLGINHMTRSWTFALAQLYFLSVLGFVTLRRTVPLNKKNFGFLLNHAGLWIAITAAILGTGDLKRVYMSLNEGQEFTNIAEGNNGKKYQLKVALKLLDFNIQQYPPKLALVNSRTSEYVESKKNLQEAEEGLITKIKGFQVEIKDYHSYAIPTDSIFVADSVIGSAPAAFVEVKHKSWKKSISGWLTSGSFKVPFRALPVSNQYMLALTQPEAKRYSSTIAYLTKSGEQDTVTIKVNDPQKTGNWRVYQSGYDPQMGQWSKTSIIELISDPWLPVVYTGFFMLLAGAVYMFWIGKDINEEKTI